MAHSSSRTALLPEQGADGRNREQHREGRLQTLKISCVSKTHVPLCPSQKMLALLGTLTL